MFEFKTEILGGLEATVTGKFGLDKAEPEVGLEEQSWFEIDSIKITGFAVDTDQLKDHVLAEIENAAFAEIKRIAS